MKTIETRNELLEILPKNMICCELGVFKGDYSKIIHEILKPSELILIDNFTGIFGSGDKDGQNHINIDLDIAYDELKEYFSFDNKVKLIKNNTLNGLDIFENNYFDYIYIDADHEYNAVFDDLLKSFEKIKNKGYISTHDYIYPYGVLNAVNDFCVLKGQEITHITKDGCPSILIQINK
jgi:hypothetical protein